MIFAAEPNPETHAKNWELTTTSALIEAVQILSPFRKRGTVCADALNGQIRELVNPREAGKEEMKSLGRIFRVGDRIIQTRNNEDVSNGEVGIISRIYTDDDGERLVDITLLDGREVTYNDELMENVDSPTPKKNWMRQNATL